MAVGGTQSRNPQGHRASAYFAITGLQIAADRCTRRNRGATAGTVETCSAGRKRQAERDRVTVIRSSLDSGAREEQSLLAAGGEGWRSRKGFGTSYPLAFFVGHALWQAALR